ncbi:helix-turn-helix protein [Thalassoglobus neptunius]|uniref:Helix-turn-helix protein n=1 Tax=Thalassoglobus neptunius TaxID=1938619 RepID=A0A5C5WDN5_9PLAN|nr:helix-turn-helix transcriptional regulator [Thalassoglobus neptunius]TWT49056.1 helix-turn-helix protein [Thalassoglobus neptunius]
MVLQEEFRRIVKDELARQGMSQSELARRMSVSRPTVSQYLSGKFCPGLDVVEKFFNALGLPLHLSSTEARQPADSIE